MKQQTIVYLSQEEQRCISGGMSLGTLRKLWNFAKKAATYIGVYDMVNDFKDGWNSVGDGQYL